MTTDNAAEPFAHGTPVGDDHMWVDPGQLDCPDCPCCVARLCRDAQTVDMSCAVLVGNRGHDSYDVTDCPCAPGGRR